MLPASKRRDQRVEVRAQLREVRVTDGVGLALGDQVRHRILCAACVLERNDEEVRRRDAVEHDALDALGVPARVDQVKARSVRPAVEHELRIAERRAQLIQIVGRDRRRIEAQVGAPCETRAAAGYELVGPELGEVELRTTRRREVALLQRGAARAAIVDEQDVVTIAKRGQFA